jgi:hypothetical protein
VNLLIDGQIVSTATGNDENRMRPVSWDVRRWSGQTAVLQVVDRETGAWGNIGLDNIRFSDSPQQPVGALADAPDFGTLALGLIDPQRQGRGNAAVGTSGGSAPDQNTATKAFGEKLVGSVSRTMRLAPGQSKTVCFVLAWHMPNLKMARLPPGRHYASVVYHN